jgi:hypothetical protein
MTKKNIKPKAEVIKSIMEQDFTSSPSPDGGPSDESAALTRGVHGQLPSCLFPRSTSKRFSRTSASRMVPAPRSISERIVSGSETVETRKAGALSHHEEPSEI